MSEGPFAGSIPGVSMSQGSQAPAASPDTGGDDGGHEQAPRQGDPIQTPRRAPKPQRARAGDFSRLAGQPETFTDVAEVGENADDPFAPLVERSIKGNAGQELARAEPIDSEVAEVARRSALDARQQNEEALDDDPIEAEATLVEDDPRVKSDRRYKAWKEAFDRVSALERGGDLPAESESWLVPLDFGDGRKGRVSIKDLKRAWNREADYHRKLQAVHEQRRANEAWEAGLQQVTTAMCGGEGQAFLAAMQLMPGAYETFVKAALIWGFQADAHRRMPPEMRQLAEQRQAIAAENARLQMQVRQLSAQAQTAQQQQPTPNGSFYRHQLEQMLPIAARILEQEGTPYIDNQHTQIIAEHTWAVFAEDFRRTPGRELTTDDVVTVLRSIMQQAEDIARRSGYQPAAATQVPPVARTAPAPSSQMSNAARAAGAPNYSQNQARPPQNGKPQRARIGDIYNINK